MKENKGKIEPINKYDKAILSLRHINYNSLIGHYGLELSQGIIRLFKAMNIASGEDNEIIFEEHSKRQISKYGISVYYEEHAEDKSVFGECFEHEGKWYEIYYCSKEYNWFHQLEPRQQRVQSNDLLLLSKLYNYLQYHYAKQKSK